MPTHVTPPYGVIQAAPGGEGASGVEVSPAAMDPLIGMTIGEFTVEAYLAHGGMGRVYTARHRRLPNLRRAVKVLADSTREADHAAFIKEASAASEVKSINIVAVHDFGFLPDGAPYLMMELLIGQTLEARLKELRTIPYTDALALVQQVLAALSAVHSAGLVHRDVKPANLFLVNDPAQGVVVKLMDLGLAAARPKVHADTGVGTEKEENRAGTPVYSSPEQFGYLSVGPASDVYSLGVVLYELVTGQAPFLERPGDPRDALPRRHMLEKPRHPGAVVPDLPEPVASFMLSLLEKEPLKRPTVAAAQNQVKRLRERFRDRLREGPTLVKPNPLPPADPPRDTDLLPPADPPRDTDLLPPRLPTEETLVAVAGMRRDKRPLLVVAVVAGLALLGLGIEARMTPDERVKPEGTPRAATPPVVVAAAAEATPTPAVDLAQAKPGVPAVAPVSPTDVAKAKPDAEPKPPVAPEEQLTALPSASKLVGGGQKSKGGAAPTSGPAKPKTVALVSTECTFDVRFRDHARQEWSTLHSLVDASLPAVQSAETDLRHGFANEDCHSVSAALEKLSVVARATDQ